MPVAWYRDGEARRFIVLGYVPWCAGLNLVWEVAHCTAGDVLIGTAALLIALMLGREGPLPLWHWRRIVVAMLVLGPGYTISGEWLNTTFFRWSYSEMMPTLALGGIALGVSPLLQWLVLPPLALYLAGRRQR